MPTDPAGSRTRRAESDSRLDARDQRRGHLHGNHEIAGWNGQSHLAVLHPANGIGDARLSLWAAEGEDLRVRVPLAVLEVQVALVATGTASRGRSGRRTVWQASYLFPTWVSALLPPEPIAPVAGQCRDWLPGNRYRIPQQPTVPRSQPKPGSSWPAREGKPPASALAGTPSLPPGRPRPPHPARHPAGTRSSWCDRRFGVRRGPHPGPSRAAHTRQVWGAS